MNFEYDTQFVSMNAGAHRRPSPLVGGPSIAWHRAFWRSNDQTHDKWAREVDIVLERMYYKQYEESTKSERKIQCASHNRDEGTLNLFRCQFNNGEAIPYGMRDMRNDMFSYLYEDGGCTITVRAVMHSEFWELSFILDFSRIESCESNNSTICEIYRNILAVQNAIIERYSAQSPPPRAPSEPHRTAYQDIIEEGREYLDRNFRNATTGLHLKANYGGMFVDVVGLILGLVPDEEPSNILLRVDPTHENSSICDIVKPEVRLTPETSIRVLDAAWPLVRHLNPGATSRNDEKKEKLYGKPEYTATLYHGSRSLFISSLGRLVPEIELFEPRPKSVTGDPVVYTLINVHPSRWQLGRLVERIHDLEVLRVAALRDFEKLMIADRKLRAVQQSIDGRRNIDEAISEFENVGSELDSGLMFRVERSQYYLSRFEMIAKQMRRHRIEGFQRYDEFVKRRVYDKFLRINDIGRRYRDVKIDVQLLLDISSRKRSDEMSKVTNQLLGHAEIIISLPLAYYMGTIIEHVTHLKPIASYFISGTFVTLLLVLFHLRRGGLKHDQKK